MTRKNARSRPHACPICKAPRQQAGLPAVVPFGIPTCWSPDEALAIFEFISEMRDIIAAIYNTSISEAARSQYQPKPETHPAEPDDTNF